MSDTQLQFSVSSDLSSGYVTVQTPYGYASSTTDVVVLPSGISGSNIVSSGYAATSGNPVTLSIGAAGQIGALVFRGNSGGFLSLQATGITTSANNLNYKIYGPGNVLVQSGTVSTTSPSIHVPQLTASGDYLAIFQPDTAGAQLSVALQADLQLTASAQSATTTASWQTDRMYFTAAQGSNLELTLNDVTGTTLGVSVTNAAGTQVATMTCLPGNPGGSCRVSLWNTVAGTYTVLVTPLSTGPIRFNAMLTADIVGPTLAPNTPSAISLGTGQVERLTFNGVAGSTATLQLSSASTVPAGQYVYVLLYQPGAITTAQYYSNFETTTSATINLANLPTTGTYTAVVYTGYGEPGSAQLTLGAPLTGTLSENGAAQPYTDNVAQQNAYLSFAANAGDNLELTLTNVAGSSLSVSVTNSSGTGMGSMSCQPSNPGASCRVSLWNLAAGTYSIVVAPSSNTIASFSVLLNADVVGPAMTFNTPYQVSLSAGQVERLTFSAAAASNLAFQLSNAQTTPTGQNISVLLYPPGAITTSTSPYTSFGTASVAAANMLNLANGGTYTAVVYTTYGEPGSVQSTLISQNSGTLSTNGASQSFITNTSGAASLTFTANAGDNLEFTLNDISGGTLSASVTNSAGAQVGSLSGCSSSCRVSLWNLAAGNYSVAVTSGSGGMASFDALLESDVVGPTLTANTPVNVNLGAGQVERLTFVANAGQSVALQLSGATTTPAGGAVSMLVYAPGAITTTDSYENYSVSSSGTLNLTNLPTSGTYTAMMYTSYGQPGSVQVTLSP